MKNLRYLLIIFFASLLGGVEIYGETYQYTFKSGDFTQSGETVTLNNINWTLSTDGIISAYDGNKGLHFGTGSSAVSYVKLTTAETFKNITSITINASGASGTTGKLDVRIGNQAFGTQKSLTKTATDYIFDGEATSGNIEIELSQNSEKKALYIKSITISYTTDDKTPTSLSFGEAYDNQTIVINKGEESSFKEPTATLTPSEAGSDNIKYSSSNEDVATVGENGDITLLDFGETTITATFTGDETYESSSSWYKINYRDPDVTDITFDFMSPTTYGYGTSSSSTHDGDLNNDGGIITSDIVTITSNSANSVPNRFWNDGIRVYNESSFTFSVPIGYIITQIEFSNSSKNAEAEVGSLNGTTWTGAASSVKFIYSGSITYTYAKVTIKKITTIDENKENAITAAENVDVALVRTLDNSDWNTFCVPFNISAEQITEVFGEGTKITEFTDVDGTNKIMEFTSVTSIEAGKPYLIKPGKEKVENPVFKGVTIVEGEPKEIMITDDSGRYSFVGIYNPYEMQVDGTEVFVGTGGKLFFPADETNRMKGMRAFIRFSSPVNRLNAISIDGDNTSGINLIENNGAKGDDRIYNLNGQPVGKNKEGLKSGIYIVNGKKVIIK